MRGKSLVRLRIEFGLVCGRQLAPIDIGECRRHGVQHVAGDDTAETESQSRISFDSADRPQIIERVDFDLGQPRFRFRAKVAQGASAGAAEAGDGAAFDRRRRQLVEFDARAQHLQEADLGRVQMKVGGGDLDGQRIGGVIEAVG